MRRAASWVCGLAAVLAWSGPALAWTGEVSWPTFFRSGPDRRYVVLDEMERGQTVEVVSCDGDWCRVIAGKSLGYVEKSALIVPSAAPRKPGEQTADPACFDSNQAGYKKGENFRYCPRPAG